MSRSLAVLAVLGCACGPPPADRGKIPPSELDKRDETILPFPGEDDGLALPRTGDNSGLPEESGAEGFFSAVQDVPSDPVEPADTSHGDRPVARACGKGDMLFEGKCVPKALVRKVVREREQEALETVRNATDPVASADAAHDLLEQQVTQAAQAEDDLDEILEHLRREKESARPVPEAL